jgi:oligoribonuclease NrnB/cAMP/cGMP phosphodiesterase (DHH superfamily)
MVIIYHSKDLDGYCSGAICKRKYPDAKLIGYDYGQLFPWDEIPAGEPVIMVDVSLDMMDMEKLACLSTKLTWIDHHASAINAYNEYKEHQLWSNEYITAVLQIGIAACEIAWEYLFPDEQMPEAVSMLGIYDTWRQSEPGYSWESLILPFQYGMRLFVKDADSFPQSIFNHSNLNTIIADGNTILEYQRQQDKLAMHGAFECEFQGYKAIMCNVRGVGSLAFDSVLKPEHEIMVGFGYTGRQWSFSLRTVKEDVDVSLIAKQFGGGGHRKAAGFAVDNLSDVIDLTEFKRAQKQY